MSEIRDVRAREILDSRGFPTVEAEVALESGRRGRAAVPSGASTGEHEAVERRDGDPDRFGGRGVLGAVAGVNGEIRQAVLGLDPHDQSDVDRRLVELDGTPTKERLGANAILAVSLATARAAAAESGTRLWRRLARLSGGVRPVLPVPQINILNGGAHASNNVDVQEFMVVPWGFDSFPEALRAGAETFHALRSALASDGHSTAVGDEGGVAPDLASSEAAMVRVVDAIEAAGHRPGEQISVAVDCAASELFDHETGRYALTGEGIELEPGELVDRYVEWAARYPVVSIEDGLDENDWDGWRSLTDRLGDRLSLVGDDLFVTSVERLERGIDAGVANAILIKPNQIGTLTETLDAVERARGGGYGTVISHRSGETEDTFIADLSVGTAAGRIKTGSTCRSERVAKYNRLLRIAEEMETPLYAGSPSGD